MDLVIQQRVDGSLQLHWMKKVELSPTSGGWVQGITIQGGSLGIPVDQVKAVARVPINEVSDPH